MAFTLQPVGPEDAADITRIFQSAFAHDHVMKHFYPHTPEQVKWYQDYQFFSTQIAESAAYGGRLTKVVEGSSGKTVAFSKWDYPHMLTAEQQEEKKQKAIADRLKKVVEGSNEGLMEDFFTQLIAGRERWLVPGKTFCKPFLPFPNPITPPPKPHTHPPSPTTPSFPPTSPPHPSPTLLNPPHPTLTYPPVLHILAVDPFYQRLGLGSMLIRPGLADADRAGAQTYIEASPDGLPLYLKHGWAPVDEMVLDMGKHGAGSSGGGTSILKVDEVSMTMKDAKLIEKKKKRKTFGSTRNILLAHNVLHVTLLKRPKLRSGRDGGTEGLARFRRDALAYLFRNESRHHQGGL
ncbi:MAG: hypothetical protein ASARMPREDX12_004027 [Alectoria sarmentosa]|nr:MAG: hypothetical protein ASARMPREDX12_004027 [Alectoria sarmentosa]